MAKGWHKEPRRHSLASRGIRTTVNDKPLAKVPVKKEQLFYGRFERIKEQEDVNVRFWLEAKNGDVISLVRDSVRPEIRISTNKGTSAIPMLPNFQETITIEKVLDVSQRRIKDINKYGGD